MTAHLMPRLALFVALAFFSMIGTDQRPLSDAEMSALAGLDEDKRAYTSNCAFTTQDDTYTAWQNCHLFENGKECIRCDNGDFPWKIGGPFGAKVRPSTLMMLCDDLAIELKIGTCVDGKCINSSIPFPGGCSGSPTIHVPQPTGP